MAIGINDLDDDDDVIINPEPSGQGFQQNQESQNDDSFISDYLKTKGIDNLDQIKFEDDNGQIVDRKWSELSQEEKFNILNTPLENSTNSSIIDTNELTQDEIDFLNQLREQGLSPKQYVDSLKPQEQEPRYKIDDLSDDEVFLLDLESRVGELNDDDAAQALNNAKQNEDFYKRQVEGIRKEYKEKEDFHNQQEQATIEEQQRLAFEEYQAKIVDAINGFNSIGNLDLNFEDKDKEELAEFMLSQDESGVNYLYQALQDPETLAKAAWFILNGEEAFNNITDYFTNQIKQVSSAQYKKGLEDGKKGVTPNPTVVIDNSNKKQNRHQTYSSINDLDDDD